MAAVTLPDSPDTIDSPIGAFHVALALRSRDAGSLGVDAVAGLELVPEVSVAVVRSLVRYGVGIAVTGLRGGDSQAEEGGKKNLKAGRRRSPLHAFPLASHPACDSSIPLNGRRTGAPKQTFTLALRNFPIYPHLLNESPVSLFISVFQNTARYM